MELRYSADVLEHFKFEEGYRNKAYLDSKDYWTIGIGHLLGTDNAFSTLYWTDEKILTVFENDLDHSLAAAKEIFPEFAILPPKVQLAILDMIFNLGTTGFRQFKTVIRMVHAGRFPEAAVAALDSKWARHDVPNRAARVAKLLSNA